MAQPAATPLPAPIPLFVNPRSGSATKVISALRDDARFALREVDPQVLEEEVTRAVTEGARRIAVSGGDGTVATAMQALVRSPAELAVLPGGTLNHFVQVHGIPSDPAAAADVAVTGVATPIDLATVNGRVFHNTSSVGAYILFVQTRERMERWLPYRAASVAAFVAVFARLRPFRVTLDVEGTERHYRSPLLFVAVGEREGKLPALGTRLTGGRRGLQVIVVRGRTRAGMLSLALAAAARGVKEVARTPHLDTFIVDHFRVELRRPWGNVAADGELHVMRAPLEYRLVQNGIRLVVPRAEGGRREG